MSRLLTTGILQQAQNSPSFIDKIPPTWSIYTLLKITTENYDVAYVRRDSDNITLPFTTNEILNGTLASWVGVSNNGFIQSLLDLSGNARHLTQDDFLLQPSIVTNGILNRDTKNNPCLTFTASQKLFSSSYIPTSGTPSFCSMFSANFKGTYNQMGLYTHLTSNVGEQHAVGADDDNRVKIWSTRATSDFTGKRASAIENLNTITGFGQTRYNGTSWDVDNADIEGRPLQSSNANDSTTDGQPQGLTVGATDNLDIYNFVGDMSTLIFWDTDIDAESTYINFKELINNNL